MQTPDEQYPVEKTNSMSSVFLNYSVLRMHMQFVFIVQIPRFYIYTALWDSNPGMKHRLLAHNIFSCLSLRIATKKKQKEQYKECEKITQIYSILIRVVENLLAIVIYVISVSR